MGLEINTICPACVPDVLAFDPVSFRQREAGITSSKMRKEIPLSSLGSKFKKRFWEKVNKTQGCWIWTACRDKRGYGWVSINNQAVQAHRASYIMHYGLIPNNESMEVCHHCDNPSCIRPDHLFIGTHLENALDAQRKGRLNVLSKGSRGTKNNHNKLTEENVRDIRKRLSNGHTKAEIARKYKIDESNVYSIEHRKSWAWLE